jgi:hypothetical protein
MASEDILKHHSNLLFRLSEEMFVVQEPIARDIGYRMKLKWLSGHQEPPRLARRQV